MVISPAETGHRIQRLRIANGLNQAQLAAATMIPTGGVSMVEHGRQGLDEATLERVADALGCTAKYLTQSQGQPSSTRPWLRAYADASKKAVDRYVADTEMAIDVFGALRLRLIPETLPYFDDDGNNEDAIEDFASEVRHAAGLADGDVVGNCIRRVERLGVVVLPMHDELGRHMGLSQRVDSVPVIRVSKPRLTDDGMVSPSGDRQRFTVAHELGHLTLHATTPPPATAEQARLVEQQAHRFAGAFLAPSDPLLTDLERLGDRVTLTTLAELKKIWGVSIKMLVVRLGQLGRIDDQHARSLYKQISARRWNKVEPVPVGHEHAIWLTKALTRAGHDNASAAAAVGLAPRYVQNWQAWDLEGPDILDLPEGVVPISKKRSLAAR
ncbi:MAG: ImmA/IrrE family metallo-endopeptidase [Actinomycetales bacterium]|uniref:ImmA/IrrE family metallo-endopeptidase n=1 Tax=Candidatus Phosphoribacter hodrii TaxID=2953743 RepID=A0A9D7XVQ7_9MICO|nr:ImmA/IrrE family metallo-endopeptidase [Candidatus Phosphoribacter hodrii]